VDGVIDPLTGLEVAVTHIAPGSKVSLLGATSAAITTATDDDDDDGDVDDGDGDGFAAVMMVAYALAVAT